MRRLFIEPLDVLMFRSERPFTTIESHVAKLGVISPMTFEGAIKSKIFTEFCRRKSYSPSDFQRNKRPEENEDNFKNRIKREMESDAELKEVLKLIGHPVVDSKPKLNIVGASFAQKEERVEHFPIPNDVVQEDRANTKIVKIVPSQKIKISNTELNTVLPSGYSKVKETDGLIELNELKRYLWGEIPKIKKNPYLEEIRSGIQIERESKRTVEGALYTAEFLRLWDGWGFVVWYESPQNIPNGLVKLGGEGKGAICENINETNLNEKLDLSKLIKKINEDKIFKLYLATPSYFGGCMPPNDKLKRMLGVSLKLIAAIPGKPVYIGGYNFAMNKEKPLRRWVNAGAVYYYRFDGEIKEDLNLPIKIIEKDIDMRCAFIGIGDDKNV
ncbi:MAG: type III-B CRISPR module-associated protein Cmr3 [Candidatus Helarchaeota archaeon]